MPAKKRSSSTSWTDPDDAPELTADMLAEAEVFKGDQFVRRGPGRPKAEVTKEKISVRLDPDVLARLRASGPGWQSRINAVLRQALGIEGRILDQTLAEVRRKFAGMAPEGLETMIDDAVADARKPSTR